MEQKETFTYTYSAKEQEEIKAIREKYTAKEAVEDQMALLRRLDTAVTTKATTIALIFGILGALVLGSGMSLAMTEIGAWIGLQSSLSMIIGVLVGLVGIVLVSIAYPLYNRILKAEREKIAPEIIRITDELMK